MSPQPTKEQARAAVTMICAISEAIREAGRIPSGVLYSIVMGRVSLEGYEKIIRILKNGELVEERSNELF